MDSVAATSEASEQKNTAPLKKERAGVTVSTGRYMLVAGLLSVAVNILLLVSPLVLCDEVGACGTCLQLTDSRCDM